jgi:hypothetical protein
VRNATKTAGQWSVNCYGVNLIPLREQVVKYTRARSAIDPGLAKGKGGGTGRPLQKADAGCFSVGRESDINAQDCSLVSQAMSSMNTAA